MKLKRKMENLERGFDFVAKQSARERVLFTTYKEGDKKYLVLMGMGNDGVAWSKHFIVEGIADERGNNPDKINNEELFKERFPL